METKPKIDPLRKGKTLNAVDQTKHDPSKTEAKGSTPVMQRQTPVPQERGKGSTQPGQEQTKAQKPLEAKCLESTGSTRTT